MMKKLLTLAAALALVACAGPTAQAPGAAGSSAGSRGALAASSPECLAAQLSPSEPFPVTAIPSDVLLKRQNGYVAVRYDVVAGKVENATVVTSQPEGLYDRYVLQHAQRYRDVAGKSVRGCVMTVDIKF